MVKENNNRVLVYSRFPMKAVSLNPPKRVPTVGHTAEASPGNPRKTSDFYQLKAYQCTICHMVRMTYMQFISAQVFIV